MNRHLACLTATITLAPSMLISGCAGSQPTQQLSPVQARDSRLWPFAANSAWNSAIGSYATYAPIVNGNGGSYAWSSLSGGFNPTYWTVSVGVASNSDPVQNLWINTGTKSSNWSWLDEGNSGCGISPSAAASLLATSSQAITFEANPYSTTCAGTCNTQTAMWPSTFHQASSNYSIQFQMPAGMCATGDTDSLFSVIQPNGWAVDIYDAITVTDGDVVAGNIASYYDTKGDGSGFWNGRRASMIPTIAGLIRTGEVASGKIPHALAATVSKYFLTESAVWPAYAFDTNAGYTGTQLPMGSLLAIPSTVDIDSLGLSPTGVIVARAAQDYGVYAVDQGGVDGVTIQVQYGDQDAPFSNADATIIAHQLQLVTNNSQQNPGGGGTPRAPAAPPFSN